MFDWADEEGARFGRSLLGSSAAAGRLNVDEIRQLRDAEGTRLEDAVRDHGVILDTMLNARHELKRINAKAYLEMHIEQGPVLESLNRSAGVPGNVRPRAQHGAVSARPHIRGQRR